MCLERLVVTDRVLLWKSLSPSPSWWTTLADGSLPHNHHKTPACGLRTRRFAMKIVVIGGTGLIGSKTVAILRQGGHEVVAASPNTGVNSITGQGPKDAMAGPQAVNDLSHSPPFDDREALEF